jgi:DNA gyrase subunit A
VTGGEEMMLVTQRGIIIRQSVDAVSAQSRPASGVRLQRLDEDDSIAAVAIIPKAEGMDEDDELQRLDGSGDEAGDEAGDEILASSVDEAGDDTEA